MTETVEVSPNKWGSGPETSTVRAFHEAIQRRVAEKLGGEGRSWEEVVFEPAFALTKKDFADVEAELLATGYRFDHSAQISVVEDPEKYKAAEEAAESAPAAAGDVIGHGDNAVRLDRDAEGIARFVPSVETVMAMLTDGVPSETIAVIDDAGGTLTAPILEGFTGILCKGGTIKSHLGVLSREYHIPCLMGVELTGTLKEGDRVRFESTKTPPAYSAEAAKTGRVGDRAQIWSVG
jgi:hypothetical protein